VVEFNLSFLGFGIQRSKQAPNNLKICGAVETTASRAKNTKKKKVISPQKK